MVFSFVGPIITPSPIAPATRRSKGDATRAPLDESRSLFRTRVRKRERDSSSGARVASPFDRRVAGAIGEGVMMGPTKLKTIRKQVRQSFHMTGRRAYEVARPPGGGAAAGVRGRRAGTRFPAPSPRRAGARGQGHAPEAAGQGPPRDNRPPLMG